MDAQQLLEAAQAAFPPVRVTPDTHTNHIMHSAGAQAVLEFLQHTIENPPGPEDQ